MKESIFQKRIIDTLNELYPGCLVLKNDSAYIQGIPDLLVLYENKWVALETKKTANASIRPNQQYYVNKMNEMSFAVFVYPENIEEVLYEIQQVFSS